MAAQCPFKVAAAIQAFALLQTSIKWGYSQSYTSNPNLVSDAECKREQCQFWGSWSWAEEKTQNNFRQRTAWGCTFGQMNCEQSNGSTK